ncbi:MAG: filamentous hemagglutinin [Ramlibacter sp.]|jgi:filamentous hemagglutinin family protein|nr:filamentous hemagglutinin [Ramlibacter sp.]
MNFHHPAGLRPPCVPAVLALSVLLSLAGAAQAAPAGGVVAAGTAAISTSGARTTITQGSASAVINWQGFGIAAGEAVQFKQPGSSSVTLNRVVGGDPSAILGNLSANGKVFLVNPNGILFGRGATVNVGGLVASTLNISDADFMAGRYRFTGTGPGSVRNEGTIQADGGYVALLGSDVSNDGTISARLGSVALAAGQGVTLDMLGDNLLQVTVDRGAVEAAVRNGGLIQADGGQVLLSAASLFSAAVNNTGVIQAQTISNQSGTIRLMGDTGSVTVAGTLDASAPNGGDGGFIETSAAQVKVLDGARVTTLAGAGRTGTWLIDPVDFEIKAGSNMSAAQVQDALLDNNFTITTTAGPGGGLGDILVNEPLTWNGALGTSLVPTTLTLNAFNDVHINQPITVTHGNLVVCCGRDVNVNAAVTTTTGSVLLSAGRNVNVVRATSTASQPNKHLTDITATNGNIAICAAVDIVLDNTFNGAALITLNGGSSVAGESLSNLGVTRGLTLAAGTGATGPGAGGGTVKIGAGTILKVVGPAGLAPINITYNPVSYLVPTDYKPFFATGDGAPFSSRMLVFAAGGDKVYDGSTATTLVGLKGNPSGVTLSSRPGNFVTTDTGTNKLVSFTDLSLGGADAANFALPVACCGPTAGLGLTTATLLAAAVPVVTPPVVVVPLPVVVGADVPFGDSTHDTVIPQFAPFAVTPVLLRNPTPLLVVTQQTMPPMQIVMTELPVQPVTVAPAPAVAPPAAPAPAPALPIAPPARAPKVFRN